MVNEVAHQKNRARREGGPHRVAMSLFFLLFNQDPAQQQQESCEGVQLTFRCGK